MKSDNDVLQFKTKNLQDAIDFLINDSKLSEVFLIFHKNRYSDGLITLVRRDAFIKIRDYLLSNGPSKNSIINCYINSKTNCRIIKYKKMRENRNGEKVRFEFSVFSRKHLMSL